MKYTWQPIRTIPMNEPVLILFKDYSVSVAIKLLKNGYEFVMPQRHYPGLCKLREDELPIGWRHYRRPTKYDMASLEMQALLTQTKF